MPLTSGICRYGENNRFVIDLKRVVEISEIDVNSSLFDQGIRGNLKPVKQAFTS